MGFIAKASLLLLGLFIGAGGWLRWTYGQPSVDARSFQASSWLSAAAELEVPGDPGCVRGAMALDLIDSKRLIGMKYNEVNALLGPAIKNGGRWTYRLGQCSGFGWEDSALLVDFDNQSSVISARFERAP